MKRFTLILTVAGLAMFTFGAGLFADETTDSSAAAVWHPAFYDSDGDGVCDAPQVRARFNANVYREDMTRPIVDEDGDGVCDYDGIRYNKAEQAGEADHVDADGDGICDNCALRLETVRARTMKSAKGALKGLGRNGK